MQHERSKALPNLGGVVLKLIYDDIKLQETFGTVKQGQVPNNAVAEQFIDNE